MRTKTLALSAVLGMLGTASLVAQTNVYSINAVGYINLTLYPGFNMIACQLQTGTNTVGSLFNDASGIYDTCQTFKYNPAGSGSWLVDTGDSQLSGNANGWDANGVSTLNPGEAMWFENAFSTNLTVTFVGTVPQGTNTVFLKQGFTMASSPVPFSGDLVTNMGLTNYTDETEVYVYTPTNSTKWATYTADLELGSGGYNDTWDSPTDPLVNVGQGFWYNGATSAITWTQVFSINP